MLTTRYILDEAHLSHYDERLKSWAGSQPVKTIPSSLYPWTLTDKAGAVSCWPVGGTQLKPTVDFMFTETGPASGDKGPENPSVIEGVSSIECSYGGKNLLYYPLDALTKTIDGATFTHNNDGSFSVSGTSTRSPVIYRIAYSTGNQSVYSYLPAGTYTLSGCPQDGNWNTYSLVMMDADGILKDNLGNTVTEYGSGRTFTIDEPKRVFCMMRLGHAVGTNISGIVYKPQLEIGSSITALEPANRSKLPLPLGNTYYGGSIDLASGVMTVTHWGFALDGSESWRTLGTVGSNFRHDLQNTVFPVLKRPNGHFTCSHFSTANSGDLRMYISGIFGGAWFLVVVDTNAVYPTNDAWKGFLATQYANGTPVTLAYQLETPFTVQLTPTSISSLAQTDKYTPRVNTVYTDAESVQVGYVKSSIREEYELTQAIVAQGGNI